MKLQQIDWDILNVRQTALDFAKGTEINLPDVLKRAEAFYQFLIKGQKLGK